MEDVVRQVAQAVLYEGYLLWPYRRSALKNQHRWTIGGVYPSSCGSAYDAGPCVVQTQCLLTAEPGASVEVRVRFLQVVARDVSRLREGRLEPVRELSVGNRRLLSWEEATEREVVSEPLPLAGLSVVPHRVPVEIEGGSDIEWLLDPGDGPVTPAGDEDPRTGAVVRHWRALRGGIDIQAETVAPDTYRLTVRVVNTTDWRGIDRIGALRRTFVSAHTIIRAERARLVSLADPPAELAALAAECDNIDTWPVLVGAEGDGHTMLSAPVILPDYPQVAPESPGDLFDATEIDQLLTLSIMTLGEEERREMRDSDPRAREILDRCAALTPEQLMRLHGRLRELRPIGTPPEQARGLEPLTVPAGTSDATLPLGPRDPAERLFSFESGAGEIPA
ncbi:hypothetical protein GCM10023322_62480 [Rugosimonospora acidiphila]|uniref:Uncharacterized protein n=1 Tax=Rugosimonospora acidiphila TaxID=556531 RepID=A0ABP9SHU8_9ACTN